MLVETRYHAALDQLSEWTMSGDLGPGRLFRPWAAGQETSADRAGPRGGKEKRCREKASRPKVTSGQPSAPEKLRQDSCAPGQTGFCGHPADKPGRSRMVSGPPEKPAWSRLTSGQPGKLDQSWCPSGFCGHPRTVAPTPTTTSFGHCPSAALVSYGPCASGLSYAACGPDPVTGDGGPVNFGVNPSGKQAKKQRPKRFPCPHCQVAFSNNGQLKGHIRIHTGERPFPCDFPDCGKTFTRNEELTRHKRIHLGLRPYSCHVCGKKFGRKDHLKKHVKTHQQKVGLPSALVLADPGAASWPSAAFYHPGYVLGLHPHPPHPAMFNMAADCGPFVMQWTT